MFKADGFIFLAGNSSITARARRSLLKNRLGWYPVADMPSCLKCGAELTVNEEGVAPVLCDRCAGAATGRARRSMAMGGSPVTLLLIAICVVAFPLEFIPGVDLRSWGVNWGPLTLSGEYWRLFTAGFLHGNILHIALNMWCLWSLGQLSERLFGKWQTFLIYVLTGVGGALLSIAYDPNRSELGASGAIFGLVGAVLAGVRFGDLRISAGEKRAIFSSVVSFAVINFALGASNIGMFANVDNMCHLGGFVSGLLVGLPLGAFARKNQLLQLGTFVVTGVVLLVAGQELVQNHGADAQRKAAVYAWSKRDYGKAARLLEKYSASRPQDDIALVMLGEAYANNNETEKAVAAFERALKINPNSIPAKQDLEELRGNPPTDKDK
jgi:membrane associated rhomboid family serine protease